MKKILKNNLWIFLCFILLLGFARFIYSTSFKENVSLFKHSQGINSISGSTIYDYNNIELQDFYDFRRWGPIGVILVSGIKKFVTEPIAKKDVQKLPHSFHRSYASYSFQVNYLSTSYASFIWRLGLFISYGITIYFLLNLISEFKSLLQKNNAHVWSVVLIFVSLQSSAAIYNITNGGGEIFTAFCIISHFYFFYKKKYFIASIFIIIGIYFKLHPIVFAFPYFIFAIFSRNHRRYIFCLFIVGAVVSLISYPFQGLQYGSLYPFSIIYNILEQPFRVIPIWSEEELNLLSLINKIINGFQLYRSVSDIPPLISFITPLFTILFILSNILAGFILSRFEYRWKNDDQLRLLYLFFFQVIIGFLYLVFSSDISIQHLLNSLISIYAPIFLFSATIHKFNDVNNSKIGFIVVYFIGLTLVGGFLPISIINIIIPYDLIDKIVGDHTNHIGEFSRFIWYQVPLLGLLIIAYVTYSYSRYVLKKK